MSATSLLNGKQNNSLIFTQQALQQFYLTNPSSSSSVLPIIQTNVSTMPMLPTDFQTQLQAQNQQHNALSTLESNNNLTNYVNINDICYPTSIFPSINNNTLMNYQTQQNDTSTTINPSTTIPSKLNQNFCYEGLPIFLVPQSKTLSLDAFQKANKFKLNQLFGTLFNPSGNTALKVDTSKHFHVFVGDLSSEIDNQMLKEAFQSYGFISEAKVMRNPQSLKSRGYGFVSFPDKNDAQKAIDEMNGAIIGKRAVRTNWASRRSVTANSSNSIASEEEKIALVANEKTKDNSNIVKDEKTALEKIMSLSDAKNTTVYIGNLNNLQSGMLTQTNVTENQIQEAFSLFGKIKEIRLFPTQNYAFVIYLKKENAALAILKMNGKELFVGGPIVRCSWGRSSLSANLHLQDQTNFLTNAQLITAQLAASQTNQNYMNAAQSANVLLSMSMQQQQPNVFNPNSLSCLQQPNTLQQLSTLLNVVPSYLPLPAHLQTQNLQAFDAISIASMANQLYTVPQLWHA